jgi:hypothetical protein
MVSTRTPRRRPPTKSRSQKPASGAVTIYVIVNSPALRIGLHALLQLENAGHRLLWGTWRDGIRFLTGEVLQPRFKRQSLRRGFRLESPRLLVGVQLRSCAYCLPVSSQGKTFGAVCHELRIPQSRRGPNAASRTALHLCEGRRCSPLRRGFRQPMPGPPARRLPRWR